jgi:hypothetical protein
MAGGPTFDPGQPRDDDGQWSDGVPGPAGDPLKLAGRIRLGRGERFAGSAAVDDGNHDTTVVLARVDGPDGMRIRLGVVPAEDKRRWAAQPRGRTVELTAAGAADLQAAARQAVDAGKRSIAEYRAELRKAIKAGLPVDEWPDTDADIAAGTIRGARWGDLQWTLTREEGGDFITVAGEEAIDSELLFSMAPRTTVGGAGGEDFNTRSPLALKKLDKAISDLLAPGTGPSGSVASD